MLHRCVQATYILFKEYNASVYAGALHCYIPSDSEGPWPHKAVWFNLSLARLTGRQRPSKGLNPPRHPYRV